MLNSLISRSAFQNKWHLIPVILVEVFQLVVKEYWLFHFLGQFIRKCTLRIIAPLTIGIIFWYGNFYDFAVDDCNHDAKNKESQSEQAK